MYIYQKGCPCIPKAQPPNQLLGSQVTQTCVAPCSRGFALASWRAQTSSNSQHAKLACPPDALPPTLCGAAQAGCCTPTRRQGLSCLTCPAQARRLPRKSTGSRLTAHHDKGEKERHAYKQSQEGENSVNYASFHYSVSTCMACCSAWRHMSCAEVQQTKEFF